MHQRRIKHPRLIAVAMVAFVGLVAPHIVRRLVVVTHGPLLALSALAAICSRYGRTIWPSSVRCVRVRSRRNRSPPKPASSSLIALMSEGGLTLHFSAARVKFKVATTARKYLT